MPSSRQLAAIMFTDIVGYTALMGEDEQKAFEILRRNRQMQKSLIEKFNGTWIKELGDGIMASFNAVTDAVLCAREIQKASGEIDDLKLRIGIHLGEVIFEEGDVFGDGVNIASRLQASAPIGSIWISGPVQKNVSNKKDIKTRFVKEEILKNVKEPVQIYELITNDISFLQIDIPKKVLKSSPEKSIAVLPFVNMSNDPDQEYFGDGMAEEILNSLVHIKDLKVAGRTSSFQFKGKNADLREMGQKLGVNTVLEGSVRKQGNRVRITAQLINVEDGYHLWSERYDRTMDDIFAIQDEIAMAITEKLKLTLLSHERAMITKSSTRNTEAYELYLKGRFCINRRGSFIMPGLENFKKALSVDQGFALAYAGYADAVNLAAVYGLLPGKQIMHEMKQAAETAIKLDDTLCEPYCSLGSYYTILERNWEEGRKHFLKGIALNTKYAQGHSWYGMLYLAWTEGNFEEAVKESHLAIKAEPLSAIDHADLAWNLHTAGKFEEALIAAKTGIELDANSFLSNRLAGLSYIGLKRFNEAIETFQNLIKLSNRQQHALTGLIWAYCNNSNFEEAKVLMEELKTRSQTEYIAPTYFGIAAAYLGDLDTAFDLLQKAYDDHDPNVTQLKYSPYGPVALYNDPRFQKLLDKIGYPE